MSDAPQQNYYYYDPEFTPDGFGLCNTGAICWFNSLLQMMLGIPALNRTLLECENELSDSVFAREYIKLLKASLGKNIANHAERIRHLNTLAGSSAAILGAMLLHARQKGLRLNLGTGQECADEGFIAFIELLGCPKAEKIFSNTYELIIRCDSCRKEVSSIRDKSLRIQMFTRYVMETEEKFCRYLRAHPSECDYYKCECGHAMTNFFRDEKLRMLREVVVIIFNKFITKDIRWFPQRLTFRAKDGGELTYKLVGKIEHFGSRVSGHYYAHSLRGESWVCLNDSSTSIGNSQPTAETFMVCYHMVDPSEATPALSSGAILA